MDELLQQFVIEAAELTQQAADDLLGLDRDPGNLRLLESAFRALHTLKGSVGLFGLAPMHTALHAAEDVLGMVREEAGELDPARIDPLLAIIEWTDRCVEQLARSGDLPAEAITESAALVLALGAGDKIKAVAPPVPTTIASVAAWATSLFDAHADLHDRDLVAIRYQPHPECFFSGDDPLALMDTVPDILAARISTRDPWAEPAAFDPFRSNLVIEALSGAAPREVEAIFRLIPDQVTLVPRARSGSRPLPPDVPGHADVDTTVRTLRVEVERIDRLVDVIGELFTAKNAMSLPGQAGPGAGRWRGPGPQHHGAAAGSGSSCRPDAADGNRRPHGAAQRHAAAAAAGRAGDLAADRQAGRHRDLRRRGRSRQGDRRRPVRSASAHHPQRNRSRNRIRRASATPRASRSEA